MCRGNRGSGGIKQGFPGGKTFTPDADDTRMTPAEGGLLGEINQVGGPLRSLCGKHNQNLERIEKTRLLAPGGGTAR